MMTLHVNLGRVAKDLRSWSKNLIPQTKLAMEVCREVILGLEIAQEARALSNVELNLIHSLKTRTLGLTVVDKNRARQKSRLTWLRK
jgi:hypothetical protein